MFSKVVFQNNAIGKKYKKIIQLYQDRTSKDLTEDEKIKIGKNKRKGDLGEFEVRLALFAGLTPKHIVINDLTLEVTPNEFVQIDHLVICSYGLFVIETKTWSREYNTKLDGWEYLTPSGERKVDKDPRVQVNRHIKLLKEWIADHCPNFSDVMIKYLIVLNGVQNESDDENVVLSGKMAALRIKTYSGQNISDEGRSELAELFKNAKLLDHWDYIHSRYNLTDDRKISVVGSDIEFYKIIAAYKNKGYKLKFDREKKEITLLDHVKTTDQIMAEMLDMIQIKPRYDLRFIVNSKRWRILFLTILVLIVFFTYKPQFENISVKGYEFVESQIQKAKYKFTPIEVMSFDVSADTSIKVIDGSNEITSRIYPRGSRIVFYSNKKIILKEPGKEDESVSINNDDVYFFVSNDSTPVIHNGNNINAGSVSARFYFKENKVVGT